MLPSKERTKPACRQAGKNHHGFKPSPFSVAHATAARAKKAQVHTTRGKPAHILFQIINLLMKHFGTIFRCIHPDKGNTQAVNHD